MDRRGFLLGTAGGIGGAALGWSSRGEAAAARPRVLRLDPGSGQWRDFIAAQTASAPAPMRLRLLGVQRAAASDLAALELDLQGAAAATADARHKAWRLWAAEPALSSGPSSVALPEDGLRLVFRLRRAGAELPHYTDLELRAWAEGDYFVLLDPRAATPAVCAEGDCGAPAGAEGFRLQLHHETPSPDLCLRADLACMAQADAEIQA